MRNLGGGKGGLEIELQRTTTLSGIGKQSGEGEQKERYHTPRYLSTTTLGYFFFPLPL